MSAIYRTARTEAEQSHHTAATQLSAAQASLKAAQAGQEDTQKLLAAKEAALAEAQQRVTQLEKDLQQLQAKLSQQAPPAPAAAAAVNGATPAQLQQQHWAQGQLRAREVELAAARMECERLRHVVAQGQQSGAVMAGHILSGVLASPGLTPAEKDKLRAEMQGMLVQVCMAPQQVAPRAPAAPTAEVK
jgi:chromosome segregation ATPase